MNRIQLLLDSPSRGWPCTTSLASSTLPSLAQPGEYSLFVPLHYESNYAYPLLVWLQDEELEPASLTSVMQSLSLRNYVAIAPQLRGTWHSARGDDAVDQAIEAACRTLNIAGHRIFLAGHRAGGTHAMRLALRRPTYFAGAVSIDGAMPRGPALPSLAESRSLPLFLAIVRDSLHYAAEQACEDLRLIHSAGLDVSLRAYPSTNSLDDMVLRDVNAWLMENVTGARA